MNDTYHPRKSATGLTFVSTMYLALLALLLTPASVSQAADFTDVDRYIEDYMAANRLPGLALAIVEGDRIVYAKGYGIADTTGRNVTPQTPFLLGSTSKAFTALAVMQLVEAGKVHLDTPVQTYLPWFSMQDGAAGSMAASRITVRHLLNHTSGIANPTGENALVVDDRRLDALERQVRSFADVAMAREPGTGMEYANANFQIAGLVVQAASNEPFEDYVRRHIFAPLDMRHSWTKPDEATADGLTAGYRFWFGVPIAMKRFPCPRGHFPSGFYAASAEDMGHFLIAQMNDGHYGDKAVLSPEGVAAMHTPVMADYAMGWYVTGKTTKHGGHLACYGSELYIDGADRRGIAVVFNANQGLGSGRLYLAAESIANILAGRKPLAPPADSEYAQIIKIVLAAFAVELLWIGLSLWLLVRYIKRRRLSLPGRGLMAVLLTPAAVELTVAISASLYFAGQFNLVLAPLFQPDLYLLGIILLATIIIWALSRTVCTLYWTFARKPATQP